MISPHRLLFVGDASKNQVRFSRLADLFGSAADYVTLPGRLPLYSCSDFAHITSGGLFQQIATAPVQYTVCYLQGIELYQMYVELLTVLTPQMGIYVDSEGSFLKDPILNRFMDVQPDIRRPTSKVPALISFAHADESVTDSSLHTCSTALISTASLFSNDSYNSLPSGSGPILIDCSNPADLPSLDRLLQQINRVPDVDWSLQSFLIPRRGNPTSLQHEIACKYPTLNMQWHDSDDLPECISMVISPSEVFSGERQFVTLAILSGVPVIGSYPALATLDPLVQETVHFASHPKTITEKLISLLDKPRSKTETDSRPQHFSAEDQATKIQLFVQEILAMPVAKQNGRT